jgi:hypothetical protein
MGSMASSTSVRSRRAIAPYLSSLPGVLLAITLVATAVLAPGTVSPVAARSAGLGTFETIPAWNTWACNPPSLSPAAISTPTSNLLQYRVTGAVLGAAYEFSVVNYTAADAGVTVDLPTAEAVFPTASGGPLTLTIGPKNVTIQGSGWSSPSLLTTSLTLGHLFSVGKGNAYLSTSKYAVMANVPSGALTLQVRWHWTILPALGGLAHNGTWSAPSLKGGAVHLPSIFYPAPLVSVVSTRFTNTTMTMRLNGSVTNTSFRMVLEYPNNGTEIQSRWENTSATATQFNATLPVTYPDGAALPDGSYLVHVHDVCGAIVHMQSVTVLHGVPLARAVSG